MSIAAFTPFVLDVVLANLFTGGAIVADGTIQLMALDAATAGAFIAGATAAPLGVAVGGAIFGAKAAIGGVVNAFKPLPKVRVRGPKLPGRVRVRAGTGMHYVKKIKRWGGKRRG